MLASAVWQSEPAVCVIHLHPLSPARPVGHLRALSWVPCAMQQHPTSYFIKPSLWLSGKEATCQGRRCALDPWVGKISWRRKWQPTPVVLPGKSHGQRSLVGCRPPGRQRVGYDLVTKQQQLCILQQLHNQAQRPFVAVIQLLSGVWLCDPRDCCLPGSSVHGISPSNCP